MGKLSDALPVGVACASACTRNNILFIVFRFRFDRVRRLIGRLRKLRKIGNFAMIYDIAIVGAGPAGLSAALYAARFCRSTIVLHNGDARASRIPKTNNAPGFDDGVAGPHLIERMTRHAERYGAQFVTANVGRVGRTPTGFEIVSDEGANWSEQALILATGLHLNQIDLPHDMHETAIADGVLRYCPVCDGYEHRGKRIGVVGCDISGAGEALFLRQFSKDVTLLPTSKAELTSAECQELAAASVETVVSPIIEYRPGTSEFEIFVEGRAEPYVFDVVYPALGVRPRNELVEMLGIDMTDDGNVAGSAIQGTNVDGVYCAGDIVEGLDQISVAMGHGAIAATKAHNWLRECDGHTVDAVLESAK